MASITSLFFETLMDTQEFLRIALKLAKKVLKIETSLAIIILQTPALRSNKTFYNLLLFIGRLFY